MRLPSQKVVPVREIDGNPIQGDEVLLRYFKTSHVIELIEQGETYFAAANQFDDKFEGAVAVQNPPPSTDPRYSELNPADEAFRELKRLTKISCWHRATYESDAMWQLYADSSKGVAVTTTADRMRAAFAPFQLAPSYGVEDMWGGQIRYVDLTQPQMKVSMLHRFFLKHRAFEWEREFRLAISLRMAEEFGVAVPSAGILVQVDPAALIDRIVLAPTIPPEDRERVTDAASRAGLGGKTECSSLIGRPRYC